MIESDAFVQALQDMGVNFFTGVPDSILGGIIAELIDRRLYTPAVREDERLGRSRPIRSRYFRRSAGAAGQGQGRSHVWPSRIILARRRPW